MNIILNNKIYIKMNEIIYKPKNKDELQKAVNLWCNNRDNGLNKFGDISIWDAQENKHCLFSGARRDT